MLRPFSRRHRRRAHLRFTSYDPVQERETLLKDRHYLTSDALKPFHDERIADVLQNLVGLPTTITAPMMAFVLWKLSSELAMENWCVAGAKSAGKMPGGVYKWFLDYCLQNIGQYTYREGKTFTLVATKV